MLVDDIGDVTITNDGATILKLLEVEHPAAKVSMEKQGVERERERCFSFQPGRRGGAPSSSSHPLFLLLSLSPLLRRQLINAP